MASVEYDELFVSRLKERKELCLQVPNVDDCMHSLLSKYLLSTYLGPGTRPRRHHDEPNEEENLCSCEFAFYWGKQTINSRQIRQPLVVITVMKELNRVIGW